MMRLFARALGCLALVGHVLACSSDPDARYPRRPSQESSYIRDYFYAGGSWVDDGTGQGTRVLQGQMYVERLSPPFGTTHPYPLVFVHGSGQTGTNFLNTPDGRKGWASWLIDHGYEVYIVDQVARGRSLWFPGNETLAAFSAEIIEQLFTASRELGTWPQASLHTQWPGSGRIGDPIFDAYYASNVQFLTNNTFVQLILKDAGAALLDIIGPSIIIAHSQAGWFPWLWADARANLVKGILAIEPAGPPFEDWFDADGTPTRPYGLTDIPLEYDPPVTDLAKPLTTTVYPSQHPNEYDCVLQAEPARQLVNMRHIPVLVETGEASFHAQYDRCVALFLRQAGVLQTEFVNLGDVGIRGNGHMQFLEKNNLEIIRWLEERWIGKIR